MKRGEEKERKAKEEGDIFIFHPSKSLGARIKEILHFVQNDNNCVR
ncbi:MAG TPA: hypothetical protein VMU10_02895 [Desulfomonilia bacterium]|nr:hypothetical protein [Desulfomonilia bacterium]